MVELIQSNLIANHGANTIGYVAVFLALICFASKEQRIFILARSGADFGFALHFILLGAHLAGYLCIVLAAVFVLRLLTQNQRLHTAITITALIVCVTLSFTQLDSVYGVVAIIGTAMAFITMLISSNLYMRLWAVGVVTPTWLIYVVIIGSIPGIVANTMYMIAGSVGLIRVVLARQKNERGQAPLVTLCQ